MMLMWIVNLEVAIRICMNTVSLRSEVFKPKISRD